MWIFTEDREGQFQLRATNKADRLIYVAFERIFNFAKEKATDVASKKAGLFYFKNIFAAYVVVIYYRSRLTEFLSVHNPSMRLSCWEIVRIWRHCFWNVFLFLFKDTDITFYFFRDEQCGKMNKVALR